MSHDETGLGLMAETLARTLADQLAALRREQDRLEQFLMLDANWRALQQLDEREAAGEPLEAIDGQALRATLVAALSANRIYAARAKIIEAIDLLTGSGPADGAPHSARVKDLAAMRARSPAIASRIVMLPDGVASTFKARLRVKPAGGVPSGVGPTHGGAAAPAPAPAIDDAEPATTTPARPAIRSVAEIAVILGSVVAAASTVAESGRTAEPKTELTTTAGGAPAEPDRLDLIAGLEAEAVVRLQASGIASYAAIASWSAADTGYWRQRIADYAPQSVGGWIEQAAVLAAGGKTAHAARLLRGDHDCLVPMPGPEPEPVPSVTPVASLPQPAPTDDQEPLNERAAAPSPAPAATPRATDLAPRVILIDAEDPPPLDDGAFETGADDADDLPLLRRASRVAERDADEIVVEIKRVRGGEDETPPCPPLPACDDRVEPPSSSREAVQRPSTPVREVKPAGRGTLLARLRQSREPDTFDSGSYAAYRSTVEEASVTIIRADAGSAGRAAAPAPAPVEDRPASVNRFLKALTGKP